MAQQRSAISLEIEMSTVSSLPPLILVTGWLNTITPILIELRGGSWRNINSLNADLQRIYDPLEVYQNQAILLALEQAHESVEALAAQTHIHLKAWRQIGDAIQALLEMHLTSSPDTTP